MEGLGFSWGQDLRYPKFLPTVGGEGGFGGSDASFISNSTWLKLVPRMIDSFNLSAREGAFIPSSSQPVDTQKNLFFLLPDNFTISTNHEYKEFANIVGVAKDITAGILKAVEQVSALAVPAAGSIKKFMYNPQTTSFKDLNSAPISVAGQALRNDNPVIYENSARKTLNVQLEFSTYSNAKSDVFDPINMLLQLSSPDMPKVTTGGTGLIAFDYPYYFELTICSGVSSGETMFGIKNAVITRISPQYKGPYVDGYPTSGSLNITFEDADPMYATSWKNTPSVVSVSTMDSGLNVPLVSSYVGGGIDARNTQLLLKSKPYLDQYMAKINGFKGFTLDTNIGDVNIGVGPGEIEIQNIPYYLSPTSLLNPRIS